MVIPYFRPPIFLFLYFAPRAWQASSITIKLYFLAIFKIASISQGWPAKWTGIMAFVLGVISFSIFVSSILQVLRRISQKMGLAPTARSIFVVATKVFGVVITSSPVVSPAV